MESTVKNVMFDFAAGREIFDEESNRVISASEVNDVIQDACLKKLGLSHNSTTRQINRALKRPEAMEFFEILEEIIDDKVVTGWNENEFFNTYVETRNLAEGDVQEFYTEDDIVLHVAKVSGDHHDHIMQKLAEGSSYTVPMSTYVVKVGTDIKLFLTGRKDWSKFIDAVSEAFIKKIQDELYSEVLNAAEKIPATDQFNKTGELSSDTKEEFDELIEDVETAAGAEAVIMGTKTALKKLNNLTDVDWLSESQKEAYANTGILGTYEGTTLMEIPQRFADNDTATKLVDNTVLLIIPKNVDRFVKFVDGGETELEVSEAGDTQNDQQSYELHRRMGIATIIGVYFGKWNLA